MRRDLRCLLLSGIICRARYVSRMHRRTGFQEDAGSILGPATYLS